MANPQDAQSKTIPLTSVRKIIGERLAKSHVTTPQVTLMREVDVTSLKLLRERLLSRPVGPRISYTDLLVKACVEALKKYPVVNSRFEPGQIRLMGRINIGVAIAVESGLIVPVIKGVEQKSLTEISIELADLILKARKGSLTLNDVTGGTFTITNLGMFGVDSFTPIINPPESAILGVGRIVEKPLIVDGKIGVRSTMSLSFTFDHRVMDGVDAAQFLGSLAQTIEKPIETEYL
jgi:pyruvate dehydrogenase E2 component (dihydrolipoamide acetyltransferase)